LRATGTRGELLVAEELIKQGFHASLPLDETQFDLVATNGENSFRIQVKSTSRPVKDSGTRYHFNITHGNSKKVGYTLSDCDFIVCVALDKRRFWVIPIEEIKSTLTSIKILPHKPCKYSKYEGRWNLMV